MWAVFSYNVSTAKRASHMTSHNFPSVSFGDTRRQKLIPLSGRRGKRLDSVTILQLKKTSFPLLSHHVESRYFLVSPWYEFLLVLSPLQSWKAQTQFEPTELTPVRKHLRRHGRKSHSIRGTPFATMATTSSFPEAATRFPPKYP